MSRRGENIYKRKDSRWEGRYIRSYDIKGNVKYGYVYAATYNDVKKKLSDVKNAGTVKPACAGKALSHYCDEWLTLNRSRIKNATYIKYHTIINRHIKPTLGNYLPHQLNTVLIERFSHLLLTCHNLSPKTVRDILTVLKSILKYLERQQETKFPYIEVVYPKETRNEMRILSTEEQKKLMQYLRADHDLVKSGILLALFTGMRIGELCALRREDISFSAKLIHVNKTMQRLQTLQSDSQKKTQIVIGEAKSKSSDRYIPLTDYTEELCRQMQITDPKAYLLTGLSNKYMEPRALQYRLSKILEECGLNGIHFHTLRHTFATRCIEVGFEIKSLSEILGHANTKVTLDRYIHSSMDLKRKNMIKLSSLEEYGQLI